jgi:hypothetical protein
LLLAASPGLEPALPGLTPSGCMLVLSSDSRLPLLLLLLLAAALSKCGGTGGDGSGLREGSIGRLGILLLLLLLLLLLPLLLLLLLLPLPLLLLLLLPLLLLPLLLLLLPLLLLPVAAMSKDDGKGGDGSGLREESAGRL